MDATQPLHFKVRRGGLWYVTITDWKLINLTVDPTPDLKALGLLERELLRAQLRFVQRQLDELDAADDLAGVTG